MNFRTLTSQYRRRFLVVAVIAVTVTARVLAVGETATVEEAVLSANTAFYRAFAERDIERMDSLWAKDKPVAVIHPGWIGLEGRDAVMSSWKGILANPASPDIRIKNARAHVYGDVAFVICYEVVNESVLIATNIFVLQDDHWKIVHHQAGAAMGLAPPSKGEAI
jgi:ketosteroid isomerase-like protein